MAHLTVSSGAEKLLWGPPEELGQDSLGPKAETSTPAQPLPKPASALSVQESLGHAQSGLVEGCP